VSGMHGIIDGVLVGAVLLASVVYATLSLGPRTLRRRVLAGTAALLGRLPRGFGLADLALRLQSAAAAKASGSCGGCDNCGSAPPPVAGGSGGSGSDAGIAGGTEIRVPVSTIGKR